MFGGNSFLLLSIEPFHSIPLPYWQSLDSTVRTLLWRWLGFLLLISPPSLLRLLPRSCAFPFPSPSVQVTMSTTTKNCASSRLSFHALDALDESRKDQSLLSQKLQIWRPTTSESVRLLCLLCLCVYCEEEEYAHLTWAIRGGKRRGGVFFRQLCI